MPGHRPDLRLALQGVAFEQAGYFTAAQAREVGYSYQAQKYHADHGNWTRVGRGLFRLPDWPSGPTDPYVRWSLWSGGRGIVSHESALELHGLSDVDPAKVHLTVPPGFRAQDVHVRTHVGVVPDDDLERRAGFAVTTVERTLFDIAETHASQETIDAAVRDAIAAGVATPRRLRRRATSSSDRAALGVERALTALAVQP